MTKLSIKHVKELPNWFKLEKYEAAKTLDAHGWYKNLFVRQKILKSIGEDHFIKALEANKQIALLIKGDLDCLRLEPILKKESLFILNSFGVSGRKEPGVRRLTIGDLYNEIKLIDIDKQNYAKKIILNTEDSEGFWDALYHTEYKKEWNVNPLLEELSCNLIHINLQLPEKLLIEQFTSLVKKMQYKRANKKPNFDGWIQFGILPYIDLRIWEKETKRSIPNSVMANAIFPPSEGGEEVVRKTTKKIIETILTSNYLMYLEDYAANEMAEQNEG